MNLKRLDNWLAVPQARLGSLGLIALLVLSSLVTPLAIDMYAPAIPHMTEYFSTTVDTVNLTLTGYFAFLAVSLLFWGPLSDRFGRKPVQLAGFGAYTLAGALCALAPNIYFLIAMRILQALGAGAISAVSMAIIKDAIKPERREVALSVVQVMFVIGPVVAPVVGALILQVADWRMTFWVLATVGGLCTVLSALFKETLSHEERYLGSIFGSIKRLGAVMKNKSFLTFLLIISVVNLPFMAYISIGSYVYISFFGLSSLQYSLFFAVTSLVSALGPFIWLTVSKHTTARKFTTVVMLIALATGVALLTVGPLSPFVFCALMLVFSLVTSSMRPYTSNILLSQQEGDTGSASSLINFTFTMMGCLGMLLAVLPWANFVVGIGMVMTGALTLSLIGWFVFLRSSIPLKGIKD